MRLIASSEAQLFNCFIILPDGRACRKYMRQADNACSNIKPHCVFAVYLRVHHPYSPATEQLLFESTQPNFFLPLQRNGPLFSFLRKPEALSFDSNLAQYIRSDLLVTSIGGKSQFTRRGFINDVPDLCTRATVALLHVFAEIHKKGQQVPRVITVSTMGIGENHKVRPLAWKLLRSPLLDKEGLEHLFQQASTVVSPPTSPSTDLLSTTTINSTPKDSIPEVIILRGPAYVEDDQPPKGRNDQDRREIEKLHH
ncbi:hypothetical protein C345_00486 [Cryptococcus neoformans A2-102-5]|nr:hypothetical protein C346_00751 [Cryptococcus neoformans var. grubii D17-1]OXG99630.1 hypothetical protein C345_00486 [Cryptococcus neoformans var. grubii A2-102-5]